ncbi:MAG: radical SAM family heme chaperone HemW [Holosporaceae bacterium]|jgi:oxygen-independent coproporphyrinogen-3 oxidase|nr:radical SAM family heme chaperone HemW [Holosporaceae bacterium]
MAALAVYVHWPFCVSKCPYCDFLSIVADPSIHKDFEKFLLQDLKNELKKFPNQSISSVFFGGGTPSLMSAKSIENMLQALQKQCSLENNAEITLEANPGTFDYQKLLDFQNAGVNRLSLGVQSFKEKNLRFLGRIYDEKQSLKATEIASRTFANFSLDFIYGYQCQTLEDLQQDLIRAVDFGCQHLSCYQLTFEENTPFFHRLAAGIIKKINENHELKCYKLINSFLLSKNIRRYEVSNYAVAGCESRHNLCYWKYQDYLGVGPGAHSRITIDGRKYEIKKISSPEKWADALKNKENTVSIQKMLSFQEELEERVIMGLRLIDGVDMKNLREVIPGKNICQTLSDQKIYFLMTHDLLEKNNEKIKLTYLGTLKMNSVLEFLLS